MRAGDLVKEIEAFQKGLIEHQRLWIKSLEQPIPTYPVRNIDQLEEQSRQLSRSLGRLRPFLERFRPSWIMHHPATGTTWDALGAATGLDQVAPVKGDSLASVIPILDQIIGELQALNLDDEIPREKDRAISVGGPIEKDAIAKERSSPKPSDHHAHILANDTLPPSTQEPGSANQKNSSSCINTELAKNWQSDFLSYVKKKKNQIIFATLGFILTTVIAAAVSLMQEWLKKKLFPDDVAQKTETSRLSPYELKLEQEARQHLIQGYFSMALKEANELVQKRPKYAMAYKLKGHAHFKLEEYSSALESFQTAINLDPKFSAAIYGKGSTLLELGYYNEGKIIFEQLNKDSPDDMAIRFNLALANLLVGDYNAARNGFLFIYEREGDYTKAKAAIGVGLSEILQGESPNQTSKGIKYFKEAVCLYTPLRALFVTNLHKLNEERYDFYNKLLQRVRNRDGYQRFLKDLEKGQTC